MKVKARIQKETIVTDEIEDFIMLLEGIYEYIIQQNKSLYATRWD